MIINFHLHNTLQTLYKLGVKYGNFESVLFLKP